MHIVIVYSPTMKAIFVSMEYTYTDFQEQGQVVRVDEQKWLSSHVLSQ